MGSPCGPHPSLSDKVATRYLTESGSRIAVSSGQIVSHPFHIGTTALYYLPVILAPEPRWIQLSLHALLLRVGCEESGGGSLIVPGSSRALFGDRVRQQRIVRVDPNPFPPCGNIVTRQIQ